MESKEANVQLNIAVIGIELEDCKDFIDINQHNFNVLPNDPQTITNEIVPHPHMILCGSNLNGISALEVVQALRMQCLNKEPIYYICSNPSDYNKKLLIKNGFTDTFLVPFDEIIVKETIENYLIQNFNKDISGYRPIKLVDIKPQTVLDFEVFVRLPLNRKYIKLCPAGVEFEQERLDYLRQHNVKWLHIETKKVPAFYKYTAEKLKDIQSESGLSETERAEKMKESIRNLIGGIFDTGVDASFQTGQMILQDCQEIVKSYVSTTPEGDWYQKFLDIFSESSDNYSKAANMATFSGLFAMALGLPAPEELALAGLLCDIGLAEIPAAIQEKRESEWSEEEKKIYYQHPIYSLNIIKRKKVSLSDRVIRAIQEQHEHFDGSGFPAQLKGKDVSVEGQILSLAYYFLEMLTSRDGKKRKAPLEAIQFIKDNSKENSETQLFDPKLIEKLIGIFPNS